MSGCSRNNKEEFVVDVMDKIELEELEKELEEYLVKYPNEQMIEATVNTLRQYVPEKNKTMTYYLERFSSLLGRTKSEVSFINPLYWLVSIGLFVLGFLYTTYSASNPLLMLVILSPLPFLFGLIEVFRGREAGLLEMEMACKYSAFENILSKLLLISIFNIALAVLLMLSLYPHMQDTSLMEVTIGWLTPFTLFVAFALWLSMKFRGAVFITMMIAGWSIFSILLVSNHAWAEMILTVNLPIHLPVLLVGVFLLVLQLKKIQSSYSSFEGVEVGEA